MIHLFQTTTLDFETPKAPTHADVDFFRRTGQMNLTHEIATMEDTCIVAPMLPFWNIYYQYLRAIYPDFKIDHLRKMGFLTSCYMKFIRGFIQNRPAYLFKALDTYTDEWLIAQVAAQSAPEFLVGEMLPFEALLADFLAGGEYECAFIDRMKALCEESLLTSIKEAQNEFLFKLHSVPSSLSSVKDFAFVHDPTLLSLEYIKSKYDLNAIVGLLERFYALYSRGYDAATGHSVYLLAQFIRILLEVDQTHDYRKLIEDDIARKFTVFFGQGKFADRMNPYLIDHIYSMHRGQSSDLKLFVLR